MNDFRSLGNNNEIITTPSFPNMYQMKTSKTNLYIKGLPSEFIDEDMMKLVMSTDVVRSVKAAIEDDGKCKGYGFIDFITPEDAKQGLKHIQVTYPTFTVKFAKENEKDKTNLYVTNLPRNWSSKDSDKLKVWFEKYGDIQSAFIMIEKFQTKPPGVGFVRFFKEDAAKKAILDLESNPVTINEDCEAPLEARFADKHAPDSRKKQQNGSVNGSNYNNIDSNIKSGQKSVLQSSNQLPLLSPNGTMQMLASSYLDNGLIKPAPAAAIYAPNNIHTNSVSNPNNNALVDLLNQQYFMQLAANILPYSTSSSGATPPNTFTTDPYFLVQDTHNNTHNNTSSAIYNNSQTNYNLYYPHLQNGSSNATINPAALVMSQINNPYETPSNPISTSQLMNIYPLSR